MISLAECELRLVKDILRRHIPGLEVWVFGSRTGTTHKKHSDLDLVLITNTDPVPAAIMAMLRDDFSESELPFRVDILDWAEITDEFRRLIRRKYEVLQKPSAA